MDCNDARRLLPAEVDGELGVRESAELEAHLSACASCRAELAAQKALREAIGRQATYFHAPDELRERISASLSPPAAVRTPTPSRAGWQWPRLAGAFAVAIALTWGVVQYMNLQAADDRLTEEIVSSHVRSMLANRTVDVASSDRHTVKPWFDGKIDFSPPVRDLTGDGFPLVGGRLDYVDHRPVAALVYRRAQHPINVFVMPAADSARDTPPRNASTRGFHTMRWTQGGMAFWAVSDVDAGELAKLVALLRAPDAK